MRQKNGQPAPYWKNSQLEYHKYFAQYAIYFSQLNPEFSLRMLAEIFPKYIEIFGKHIERDPASFNMAVAASRALCLVTGKPSAFYHLSKNDSVIKDDHALTQLCTEFTDLFFQLLLDFKLFNETYGDLVNGQLAYAVYSAICFGFSELRLPPQILLANGGFSEELLDELWEGYSPEEWIRATEANLFRFPFVTEESFDEYKKNPSRPGFLPPAKDFQFINFEFWDDVQEYEKRATLAYQNHIKTHFQSIEEKLKRHGWTRNKAEKYERAEWLVIWNKYDFKHLWEIIQYVPEFSGVDVNNDSERKRIVDNLSNAFKRFEELGLPIRKPEGTEKL